MVSKYFAHDGVAHEDTSEAIKHSTSDSNTIIYAAVAVLVLAILAYLYVAINKKRHAKSVAEKDDA